MVALILLIAYGPAVTVLTATAFCATWQASRRPEAWAWAERARHEPRARARLVGEVAHGALAGTKLVVEWIETRHVRRVWRAALRTMNRPSARIVRHGVRRHPLGFQLHVRFAFASTAGYKSRLASAFRCGEVRVRAVAGGDHMTKALLFATTVILMLCTATTAAAAGPIARFSWTPTNPTVGQPVHFDGTASSCTSTPCSYAWVDDGPDGPGGTQWPLGSGGALDFTFVGVGTKYVRLTVTDRWNRSASVEYDVVVAQTPPLPLPLPPPPPPPPPGTCSQEPFCGDFETGDLTQWTYVPLEGTGSITVGTAANQPVNQGIYSAQFQTNAGTGAQRAELNASQAQTGGYPGQEWYYGWWTDFPTINGQPQQWWPDGASSNVIAQFQSVDFTAWMGMGVDATHNWTPADNMYFGWGGAPYSSQWEEPNHKQMVIANPIQYDHWYHFIVHAKWSTDPTVGFVEVLVDGTQVVPKTFGATLYDTTVSQIPGATAPGAYAELDLYHPGTSFSNTVLHDGFCRAATYDAAVAC